jgi:hypothetical protein
MALNGSMTNQTTAPRNRANTAMTHSTFVFRACGSSTGCSSFKINSPLSKAYG